VADQAGFNVLAVAHNGIFGLLQWLLEFKMPTKRSSELVDAMRARCLVRFSRRFETSTIHGYIVDVESASEASKNFSCQPAEHSRW